MLFSCDLGSIHSFNDTLQTLANLIYLARNTEPGSAGQFYCLDQAADVIAFERNRSQRPGLTLVGPRRAERRFR